MPNTEEDRKRAFFQWGMTIWLQQRYTHRRANHTHSHDRAAPDQPAGVQTVAWGTRNCIPCDPSSRIGVHHNPNFLFRLLVSHAPHANDCIPRPLPPIGQLNHRTTKEDQRGIPKNSITTFPCMSTASLYGSHTQTQDVITQCTP